MDKMSLFSVMTVSVPEAFLNIIIGMLIVGKKEYLSLNKANIIKLLLSIFCFVGSSWAFRSVFQIGALTVLPQIAIYITTLSLIYRMHVLRSFLCVLSMVAVLISIELTFVPMFFAYMQKTVREIYNSDILRLLGSLPERFVQIGMVASLWNISEYVNFRKYKKFSTLLSIFLACLFCVEFIYLYDFTNNVIHMSKISFILHFVGSLMFAFLNFSIYKIMTTLIKSVKSDYEKNKASIMSSLDDIMKLI